MPGGRGGIGGGGVVGGGGFGGGMHMHGHYGAAAGDVNFRALFQVSVPWIVTSQLKQ